MTAKQSASHRPVLVAVTGLSGSGKTTLITLLVKDLTARGCRVGTFKHASHRIDLDREGKDTWLHREAGARRVAALSPDMLFYTEALDAGAPRPSLERLVGRLFRGVDLVLAEGFTPEPVPRIEVLGPSARSGGKPGPEGAEILARIRGRALKGRAPSFRRKDLEHLTELLLERVKAGA